MDKQTKLMAQAILKDALQAFNPEPRVYNIEEAAKLLKCKERSIKHHLYEAKDLKYLILGREVRILETDLREFLEKRRKPCVHDKELLP